MNITSINYINSIKIPFKSNNKISLPNIENRDTFTRTAENNDIQSFENFINWAEEHDFLANIKDIADKTGKILGSGFEGITFEIPDTENWVLKQYKRSHFLPIRKEKPEIIKINDIAPELNIGQPVAEVYIPSSNPNYSYSYWILKRQTGNTYGVPFVSSGTFNNNTVKYHIDSLKQASLLPQEAYDKCIKDITYITEQGYAFDFNNPNNIMIDEKMQEIHFVDINDRLNDEKEQYAKILFSLLDAEFGKNFALNNNDIAANAQSEELAEIIIKKFFTAMKNQNVKFDPNGYINSLINTNLLNSVLQSDNKEEKINRLREEGLL